MKTLKLREDAMHANVAACFLITDESADMKPFGKFHMVDLDKIGGVPVGSNTKLIL